MCQILYYVAHASAPIALLEALRVRLPQSAAFSGATAAWLHGLDLPPTQPVEVTVPKGCGVSSRARIHLRRGSLTREDVIDVRGLPVTTPVRTLFDLSRHLSLVDAV